MTREQWDKLRAERPEFQMQTWEQLQYAPAALLARITPEELIANYTANVLAGEPLHGWKVILEKGKLVECWYL